MNPFYNTMLLYILTSKESDLKMQNITLWLTKFTTALEDTFGDRIWFAGLQGSHARGEATENSDIDIVVILDKLSMNDITAYNNMLDTLDKRELACGFLSGKEELLSWEPSDLFQFYYDTNPIKGSLDALLPLLDKTAIDRAIKTGACNIYHGCVHNMLYEKSEDILRGLYKSASFTLQAIAFRETGKYIRHQRELLSVLSDENRVICESFLKLKNGGKAEFDDMSEALFNWAKMHIK